MISALGRNGARKGELGIPGPGGGGKQGGRGRLTGEVASEQRPVGSERVSPVGAGERTPRAEGEAGPGGTCLLVGGVGQRGGGEAGVGHMRGRARPPGQVVTGQTTREKRSEGVTRTWVWLPEGGRLWGWCSAAHSEGQQEEAGGSEGGWRSPSSPWPRCAVCRPLPDQSLLLRRHPAQGASRVL